MSNKTGRLSVVISNYNHAHYLSEAIEAILNQSIRPFEVIIVDDGSTDNSIEVIKKIALFNPEVHLYRNDANMGVIYSSNRGLSLVTGEFIYFAAADDRVSPGFFEKSITLLNQYPQAGMCSALMSMIGMKGEDKGWIPMPVVSNSKVFFPPGKVISKLTAYGPWFAGQTVIYRLDAILDNTQGFLPELYNRTDHFVNYVVAARRGVCFIPEILATYRLSASGYAESVFDNEDLSRKTFSQLLELMRSPRYSPLFPERFVKVLQNRGWYDLEVRSLNRIGQSQIDFIDRLKGLRPRASVLDKLFFIALKVLITSWVTLAKIYLWHRRINWDFRWLAMKFKTYFSKYVSNMPAGNN